MLAEELIVENNTSVPSSFLTAMHMVARPQSTATHMFRPPRDQNVYASYDNNSYRPFNRNRGRVRPQFSQRSYSQRGQFQSKPHGLSSMNSGVSRHVSPGSFSPSLSGSVVCQLCHIEGHTAPSYGIRGFERPKCTICGKPNHAT